ncbi:MAG TPA: ribosome-binding factor A [Patescibacteria group bacterium]|nr:ribosome-binding factor A [Patescibacteria group bacterium]
MTNPKHKKEEKPRVQKMNSYVHEVLSPVINEFLENEKGLTTVTHCEVSYDLKWVKVYISVFGNEPMHILELLNKNIYELQGKLNDKLQTKVFPKIQLYVDDTPAFADEITRYIEDLKKNDQF